MAIHIYARICTYLYITRPYMHASTYMNVHVVSQESDEDSDESDDEYSQNGYSTGPGTMPQAASPADTQVPVSNCT